MNKPIYFLYGYYGCGNLGDELLLEALISGIIKDNPFAAFYVRNLSDLQISNLSEKITLTNIEKIITNRSEFIPVRIFKYLYAYYSYFGACDYLIIGGGTLIHDNRSSSSLLLLYLICVIAKFKRVKIIGVGLGISNLSKKSSRFMLNQIVAMSNFFSVRDKAAYEECKTAKCNQFVNLTADLVYSLDLNQKSKLLLKHNKVIGLSLLHYSNEKTLNEILKTLRILIDLGWQIKFFSFQNNKDESFKELDDKIAIQKLLVNLDELQKTKILVVDLPTEMAQLELEFSSIDIMIGMRYHGLILASLFGKPFVGISHDNKIEQICRMFKMPYFNTNELNASKLSQTITEDVSNIIDPDIIRILKIDANRNFEFLSS